MTLIGGLQGLIIWGVTEGWENTQPLASILVGFSFFVVASSLVHHFARNPESGRRLIAVALGAGVLFGSIGLYVGARLPPKLVAYDGDAGRLFSWIFLSSVALFILMPFIQIYDRSGRARFAYRDLFKLSWNNFLIGALGALFLLLIWIILLIWAALFELIGIGFFQDFFEEGFFICTASGSMLAYGIAAAKESDEILATLRGVVRSLFQAIYPLLASVTLLFVGSLPFTGLEPLLETQSATSLMAWWIAFGIVFLNAVYGDGETPPPYLHFMKSITEIGTLVFPILGGIGLYGIWLRVDQYGLTPDRVYLQVGIALLMLYSTGYALAVLRRGKPWLPLIRSVNKSMAWMVLGTCFLLHTPIGDPIDRSLRSQLQRLHSGKAEAKDFDYGFLRFHLGRKGYEALQSLAEAAPENSIAAVRTKLALSANSSHDWKNATRKRSEDSFHLVSVADSGEPPEGLRHLIQTQFDYGRSRFNCLQLGDCEIFSTDLIRGGAHEWILIETNGSWTTLQVFQRDDLNEGKWVSRGLLKSEHRGSIQAGHLEAIRRGDFSVERPTADDLVVGDTRLHFVQQKHN